MNQPGLDPTASAVKATLRSLRTRNGLRVERLAATAVSIAPLERLESVSRIQADGVDRLTAIVEAVREAAMTLSGTPRLITDAALSLSLTADRPSKRYQADLDGRRKELLRGWESAHRLLGVSPIPAVPTMRALRLELEDVALEQLAQALVSRFPPPNPYSIAADPDTAAGVTSASPAIVVGAAVVDLFFSLRKWPVQNTSVQSYMSARQIGGKGLNQATQLARLNTSVGLVAAIADDSGAAEIRRFLHEERVDTSTVDIQSQTVSPYTLVLTADGSYFHAGSGQRNEATLSADFIMSKRVRTTLERASAVLLTLEPPLEVIRMTLKTIEARENRPITFLTASPPLEGVDSITSQDLNSIDYLVGTKWELQRLATLPGGRRPELINAISNLHTLGVHTVCALKAGTYFVSVKSDTDETSEIRYQSRMSDEFVEAVDESASSDSFVSALAARLIAKAASGTAEEVTQEDFDFAWHAFLAARSQPGTSPSLPILADIKRVAALLSVAGSEVD